MDKLIEHFGTFAAIAEALREIGVFVTPQAVGKWARDGVPIERCPQLERASGGAVKCADMRSDVEWVRARGKVTAYTVKVAA